MISIDITESNMYMLMFGLICSFTFKTKSRSCSPRATRSAPGSGYRLFKYFPFGRFRIWHGLRLPVSLRSPLAFGLGLTFLLIYIYIIWNLNLKTNLNLKIISKNQSKYSRHIVLKINPPSRIHLKIDTYWSKNKRGEDGLKIDAIHLKINHRIQYRYVLLIIGLPLKIL